MSYRPNSQGGRRGRGGGRGGRGGGGGGGRGGRGDQRWWDPAWRAQRLRQMEAEKEIMDKDEWWGKMEQMKAGSEQEMIIRRNFSRDDQNTLADMAYQLGLYFHAYNKGKALAVSKVPLPNYRADLDEQHGSTTKVIKMSTEIEDRVGHLLKSTSGTNLVQNNSSSSSGSALEPKPVDKERAALVPDIDSDFKGLNIKLKEKQEKLREGGSVKAMLAFREKLPAFKVKSEFLKAVASNQVQIRC